MTITSSLEFTFMQFQTPHIAAKKISTLSPGISRKWLITSHKFVTVISNIVLVIRPICDPTALNELRWYSVTIRSAMIFDLQVKNFYFQFSSKSGASGIFLFKNITFKGQMRSFMTVSCILNCNCCNTVEYKTNFLSPISQNGTLYGSQVDLLITLEPLGRFA